MMLKVCTEKEAKKYLPNAVAGGITFSNVVKIFMQSGEIQNEEDCTVQILTHEILHYVLRKEIDEKAKVLLDNIHKRVYVLDLKSGKLYANVIFVLRKKGEKRVVIC